MNGQLLQTILERSRGKDSRIHGPIHWAGVAAAGLTLCELTPEADRRVVLLFAVLHDSMRDNDVYDPEHGARAAELARKLRDELQLDDERFAKLESALIYHDKGKIADDPTIGACWDADRLNFWRAGITPKPSLMSTAAGRTLTPAKRSRLYTFVKFNWPAIFASYEVRNTVYLRFGDLPPGGCSAVPIIGFKECGVSVYPARRLEGGTYVLDFHRCLLGIDTRFLAWLLKQARPLYVLKGRQVGLGGMGEPTLENARIVEEVSPRNVTALPGRPRFHALIQAWRAKREGRDPGALAFVGAKEPDERHMFPFVGGPRIAFRDMVEGHMRAWGWHGIADGYKRQGEKREAARQQATNRAPWERHPQIWERDAPWQGSCQDSPWKESPWT